MSPITQICRLTQKPFIITDEDQAFYAKMGVPLPTLCPEERMRRRMAQRNQSTLYVRKSDLSGKQIVSMYRPGTDWKVYDQDEWWGDAWSGLDHGRDFDFNRPFFDQLFELKKAVPHMSLQTINTENSYYNNYTLGMRDCYLVFGGGDDENCLYGRQINRSKNCVDCLVVNSCEHCYEGTSSSQCYQCFYFKNCQGCSFSMFLEDSISCTNCIACFGLVRKEYCIQNQFVGKENYEKFVADLGPLTHKKIAYLQGLLDEVKAKNPHRASQIFSSENCTGDALFNSKNSHDAFDSFDTEDSAFLFFSPKVKNSMDCSYNAPGGLEWAYEMCSAVGSHSSMFDYLSWYNAEVFYSMECHHSQNLLGCVGLKRQKYCILNKQYTKEEYEALVPRIIEHMKKTGEYGEFFPIQTSAFAYNETVAQEFFPLTKEEALRQGFDWFIEEKPESYQGPVVTIPETIAEVSDSITQSILTCEITQKLYKIIPQELAFYRTMGLPLPRRSPDQRHLDRMARRNPRKLFARACTKCATPIQTTYAPDQPEMVYCEKCYLQVVY